MELSKRIVSPQKLVQNQGAKILVYGMAGAGKTTLAKTCPGRVLVISAEAGLLAIKDANNVDAIEVKEASEVMELHDASEHPNFSAASLSPKNSMYSFNVYGLTFLLV